MGLQRSVCVCDFECERERESKVIWEREPEREPEIETEREKERETVRETVRERQRETGR